MICVYHNSKKNFFLKRHEEETIPSSSSGHYLIFMWYLEYLPKFWIPKESKIDGKNFNHQSSVIPWVTWINKTWTNLISRILTMWNIYNYLSYFGLHFLLKHLEMHRVLSAHPEVKSQLGSWKQKGLALKHWVCYYSSEIVWCWLERKSADPTCS